MVSREKQTLHIVLIVSITFFIIILSFLVWLILSSDSSENVYENPKVAHRVVRGTIYDRNGEILAIETPYYALALHLWKIDNIDTFIEELLPIIDMSETEVKKDIRR